VSTGYRASLFACSYVYHFSTTPACDGHRQTHTNTQTDRHTTMAYTAPSIARAVKTRSLRGRIKFSNVRNNQGGICWEHRGSVLVTGLGDPPSGADLDVPGGCVWSAHKNKVVRWISFDIQHSYHSIMHSISVYSVLHKTNADVTIEMFLCLLYWCWRLLT